MEKDKLRIALIPSYEPTSVLIDVSLARFVNILLKKHYAIISRIMDIVKSKIEQNKSERSRYTK